MFSAAGSRMNHGGSNPRGIVVALEGELRGQGAAHHESARVLIAKGEELLEGGQPRGLTEGDRIALNRHLSIATSASQQFSSAIPLFSIQPPLHANQVQECRTQLDNWRPNTQPRPLMHEQITHLGRNGFSFRQVQQILPTHPTSGEQRAALDQANYSLQEGYEERDFPPVPSQ